MLDVASHRPPRVVKAKQTSDCNKQNVRRQRLSGRRQGLLLELSSSGLEFILLKHARAGDSEGEPLEMHWCELTSETAGVSEIHVTPADSPVPNGSYVSDAAAFGETFARAGRRAWQTELSRAQGRTFDGDGGSACSTRQTLRDSFIQPIFPPFPGSASF